MNCQLTVAAPSYHLAAVPLPQGRAPRCRVALYSHDTMGVGHMRRNLLIAQALVQGPTPPVVLLLAGAREVNAFGIPEGTDCLSLPAFHKAGNGDYRARHLDISPAELTALRGRTIAAALDAFAPDVLIVDKVPRGAANELDATLASLARSGRTRCVLGLRDVLDDPATVRREWAESRGDEAIRAYYDAIWVYGDASVCDPVVEYGLPADIAARVRFTGYLDQRQRTRPAESAAIADLFAELRDSADRLVLCMVGGGQDGARLADAFARTILPPRMLGVLLTGPFIPPEARQGLQRLAAVNPRLKVLTFVNDTGRLLERADRVIAMGGYNTVCDVLSFDKPALIVPRVHPRHEQLIRAERLRDRGLLDVLHPAALTPSALTDWLGREPRPRPPARQRIDLDGLARLPLLLHALLTPSGEQANRPRPDKRLHHASC